MTGFESDEFLSFDFDEPFVFKKPTSDRSTNEVAGPRKVRITEAIANLKQFSRKKKYVEPDNDESEDDTAADINNNSPSDSDTDEEDAETYLEADDFLYSGSKSSLKDGVDSNPLPPPVEPKQLKESKIRKMDKQVRRHGYFECRKCKHNWECSYVFCNFDSMKNGKPIYKPIRGMTCDKCETRNYPRWLRPVGSEHKVESHEIQRPAK